MAAKFAFVFSTRFWALIIGGLAIASEGNFTAEAWSKAISFVVLGFVGIRTWDRTIDKATE